MNYYRTFRLPSLADKQAVYKEIHQGIDPFGNIFPIDECDAKPFRNLGGLFTTTVPHEENLKIRHEIASNLSMRVEREAAKKRLREYKNHHDKSTRHQHLIPESLQTRENWYPRTREKPMFRAKSGIVSPASFHPSATIVAQYEDFTEKTIREWVEGGTLLLQPKAWRPDLCMGLVYASMETKPRLCLDGGSIKILEARKAPCVLEDLYHVKQVLKKNEKLVVVDDRRGFHLCRMNKESRKLLSFQYKGRFFSYRALPFGLPRGPSSFQMTNMVVVSYLREFGVKISIYLDDRLIRDNEQSGEANAILSLMLITAAGGVISLAKSDTIGKTKQTYLGKLLDPSVSMLILRF